FFFSSRRRHTRCYRDWSSDVCSSDLMNPTILLVDLASAERENWKAFLEDQKYDVLTADNAESARRLCLELQPDLVLLHDHLPQVRGFELCRRLKEDPVNHLTPVVLVSEIGRAHV